MITTTTDDTPRALKDGVVYMTNDRYVCATVPCAGATALTTGRTIHGTRVVRVGPAEVRLMRSYGLALTCECGRLTAGLSESGKRVKVTVNE